MSDSGPQDCRGDGDDRGAGLSVVAQKSFDDSLVPLHQRFLPVLSTLLILRRMSGSMQTDSPNCRAKEKRLTSL
ncbi:hypothetical protein HBDW_41600 [Herbaspirillum sp. DW155]|uniref:hypothetical protein n=1 Tax=Herbaspirillum sp. DW155 TaxID=3095609 RepID=UPI0030881869|nr:hypothetical protein HBDW_41600 [Herbaspirillum sp. DW155]